MKYERVRRRSPPREEGRERKRDQRGKETESERERRKHRYEEDERERERGKERERESERERRKHRHEEDERERERGKERESERERRKHRYEEDERERERERERRKHRYEEDERERENKKRKREEEDEKRKKIQEDEESLKRDKWAKRWQQPTDHEKGNASTVAGIPAAPLVVVDSPIAAVLRRFPNLGTSETPSIQAGEQPTKCLVLKNVFDPNLASKEGSKFYKCIRDDLHQRCGVYGAVHHIRIDENFGFVYMKFDTIRSATLAQEALHEKPYKERVITANFVGTNKYDFMFGTWRK